METRKGEVIQMDKGMFARYKKNKRELPGIERAIKNLKKARENVPDVIGKVTKSSDEFPYIQQHVTVTMKKPKEAQRIDDKLDAKEKRLSTVKKELAAVESFIKELPEGLEKQIFELVFLEGKSYRDAGEEIGYSAARISQIISETIEGQKKI